MDASSTNPLAWRLADLPAVATGPKVFSCFHCGGGSSMGYKLAGCDVLGGVEIDPRMVGVYRANLKPRISFESDIRTAPLPDVAVDILDGSPPCSTFSMAGDREKSWGKLKQFSEGQAVQRLDDLFFAFIDYAEKVRPRIVIAENVTGMLRGNARSYVRRIAEAFRAIGYTPQLFQLSAAHFGVPQARERVFFIAQRAPVKELRIVPNVTHSTTIREALADIDPRGGVLEGEQLAYWRRTPLGRDQRTAGGKKSAGKSYADKGRFGTRRLNPDSVAPTLAANGVFLHWDDPRKLTERAYARLQSFPDDYNFCGRKAEYVCGMSVPPFMMRGIASQIVEQVF